MAAIILLRTTRRIPDEFVYWISRAAYDTAPRTCLLLTSDDTSNNWHADNTISPSPAISSMIRPYLPSNNRPKLINNSSLSVCYFSQPVSYSFWGSGHSPWTYPPCPDIFPRTFPPSTTIIRKSTMVSDPSLTGTAHQNEIPSERIPSELQRYGNVPVFKKIPRFMGRLGSVPHHVVGRVGSGVSGLVPVFKFSL